MAVSSFFPVTGALIILFAVLITFIIKTALIDQFALIWVIVAYQNAIKGKSPDSQTMDKLAGIVPKFKELIAKAGTSITTSVTAVPSGMAAPLPREKQKLVSQLVPFIRDQKANGYSDAQIRAALKNKGWEEIVVNEALNQVK